MTEIPRDKPRINEKQEDVVARDQLLQDAQDGGQALRIPSQNKPDYKMQRTLDRFYRDSSLNYNAPEGPAPTKNIGELITQLGDPKFAVREEASRMLNSLDGAALPVLKEALTNKDAEIRARAEHLINQIELRSVLHPGQFLIEANEEMPPSGDSPLPDNWEQLCDEIIKTADQIDKDKLTEQLAEFQNNANYNIECADLSTLETLTTQPRFRCAQALIFNSAASPDQHDKQIKRGIDLLSEALEKGEVDPTLNYLFECAAEANALENPRFLNAWRNAMVRKYPDSDLLSKTNEELKTSFDGWKIIRRQ